MTEPAVSFKAVIFGTDFSVLSQAAGLYSAVMAKYFAAQVIVAHAFTLNQAAMEVEIDSSLISQQRKDLEMLLSQKAAALGLAPGEAVPMLIDGDPKDVLLSLAEKYEPSLLVLGTHGEGWVKRKMIGSVADRILHSARQPVLTAGPRVRPRSNGALPFHRILFATDLTAGAAKAAAMTATFARTLGAEMDVLNVVEDGAVAHPERLQEITKDFYSGLDMVVPAGAVEFCHPRTFVEVGNAHEQILQHIKERSVDLLVLGIRKTSPLGMKRKTAGAFRLIREADCPVLTVPS